MQRVGQVAEASTTGHGTNVIAGVALGLESTALPTIVISIAIIAAYWLGKMSGLQDEAGTPCGGLFGTAVATMGMLSTAAYVLAMDIFGPISDNAGGVAEMSQQPSHVREVGLRTAGGWEGGGEGERGRAGLGSQHRFEGWSVLDRRDNLWL